MRNEQIDWNPIDEEPETPESELRKMGITPKKIQKIKNSPRLLNALQIALLAVGLVLIPELTWAQNPDTENYKEQGTSQSNSKEQEKGESLKHRLVEAIIKLQKSGLLKYNGGRAKSIEPATCGQVGEYKVECTFRYFPHNVQEGEVTGSEREWISVTNEDDLGTTTYVDSRFGGGLRGYQINTKSAPDLELRPKEFFFTQLGVVLGGNRPGAYYRELSQGEVERVITDLEDFVK